MNSRPARDARSLPADERLRAAYALASDAAAVEATGMLEAAGIPVILLKGPALADWLYERDVRAYGDADLLVPSDRFDEARRMLEAQGYRERVVLVPEEQSQTLPHGVPLRREAQRSEIDLHRTIAGAQAEPEQVWDALSRATVSLSLGGREVAALPIHARALLVALHATHHRGKQKTLEDLSRAVERADIGVWRRAAGLAAEIEAGDALAIGMRLLPRGAAIADTVGLARPRLLDVGLSEPLFRSVGRLAEARSAGQRLAILRDKVLPSPETLRWWVPVARRGWLGLAAGYVYRWWWLARWTPSAVREWRHRSRA